MDRLDKVLSKSGEATRKEAFFLARSGRVSVNGEVVKDSSKKIDADALIEIDGKRVETFQYKIILMNKPEGYVTSTKDGRNPTVMSLLPEKYIKLNLLPVGRLDKDTTGVLLFTNDGSLLHSLISPKREVEKEYLVTHSGVVKEDIIASFSLGITLSDGTKCKKATLIPVENGKSRLIITEGMYHQVKRMMGENGLEVTALERIREGEITLDGLERGRIRELDLHMFEKYRRGK